ncbi:MAG: molybdate ABC transporter substrate-binding protein [Verrucomicrobiota bacterium]
MIRPAILCIVCLGLFSGCGGSTPASKQPLIIYAAASLNDALQEAGMAYTDATDKPLIFNFAGSGTLARQLMAAPRADAYISASEQWMQILEADSRVQERSRSLLLSNQLVLVAHPQSTYTLESPKELAAVPFRYLALGDPAYVPAGAYAKVWLEGLPAVDDSSLWTAMQGRLSPTPDVRAALVQVETNRDAIGVVYRSEWMARQARSRLIYEVPLADGPAIRYEAAILKGSSQKDATQAFLEYLQSTEAAAIFRRHGLIPLSDLSMQEAETS